MLTATRSILLLLTATLTLSGAVAYTEVTVMAPAVAQTSEGWIGVASFITVSASEGDGRIFVDTFPLTQIDTQGSARLAAEAAASLARVDLSKVDLYIVIRSDSPVLGGPSAGGTLAVAILASLLNRTVDPRVVMTGTINPDGTIGPIGGVVQKAEAVHSIGAERFLVPQGQTTARENPDSNVLVDVGEFALSQWNLTVMEVDDLREAAKWMVGVDIKPAGEGDIDLGKYNEVMSAAAREMLDAANDLARDAGEELESAGLTFDQRRHLDPYNHVDERIDEAEQARVDEKFYLSASYAFQAKINATYILNALRYFKSQRKATAKEVIEEAESIVEDALETVNETSFTSVTAFECYAAAEKRAFEALRSSETAWELYYDDRLESALWESAYMSQRAQSALWWASLCQEFPGDIDINGTVLRDVAQEYLADLKYLLAYAQSFGQTGSPFLAKAEEALQTGVNDNFEDGAYAAAILESLKARSNVNAHLELAASLASGSAEVVARALLDKVDREKAAARDSIAASREFGVNPILAISHLEFGESHAEEPDPSLVEAIIELKYARLVAEMSPVISQRLGSMVGGSVPDIEPFEWGSETVYRTKLEDVVAVAAVFLAIGVAIGLVISRRKTVSL
jgi:uncharacterized protein